MIKNPTQMKDLMYHFAPDSGATEAHCHGTIVGAVGALMATGMTWREAIAAVAQAMPDKARLTPLTVPSSWMDSLNNEIKKARGIRLTIQLANDRARATREAAECCDGTTFHSSNCPRVRE